MPLALFGGLSGRVAAKWLVLTLPVSWLLGTGLGLRWPGPTGSGWMPALSMLLAGLLAAVNPHVPTWVPTAIAVGLGMVHGFLNGRTMASTATSFLAAVGIVVALGLVALLLGAWTSSLRVPWQKIAARTLGSWMAAIGLLALAWSLRPGAYGDFRKHAAPRLQPLISWLPPCAWGCGPPPAGGRQGARLHRQCATELSCSPRAPRGRKIAFTRQPTMVWRSEARVDAQPEHHRRVHVPDLRTGGIEPPLERLIDDLQVERRVEPGGDRGIVIQLDRVPID